MRRKKIRIDKFSDKELVFFISYGVFLVFALLSQSFYQRYIVGGTKLIIFFCCAVLVFLELQNRKLNKRGIAGLLFCLLLFAVTFMGSQNEKNTVPAMFLFIYSARNIDFRKIAKFTLIVSTIMLLFIVTSAKIGIIEDYIIVQYQSGRQRVRDFIGFRYALYPSSLLFNITSLYVYLKKSRIKLRKIVLLGVLNYVMYSFTNSRLTFVLSEMLLLLAIVLKNTETWLSKREGVFWLGNFVFIIAFAISMYLTMFYNPQSTWMYELNKFLGSRLSLGKASLITNGIPLLGRNINWVGAGLDMYGNQSASAYTYVDSFYIQTIQHYGLIFEIVLLIMLTMTMFKVRKSKDWYLFMVLGAIAFHFIIDDLQLHFYYNTFWFVIGNVLMSNMKNLVNKETLPKGFGKRKLISNTIIK